MSKSVNDVPHKELTPSELADKIKQVAKNISESSIRVRDTIRILRQSGAITELAVAVRTVAVASRDTANEISETVRELRQNGLVMDTAGAIEDTTNTARQTADMIKQSAKEIRESMPQTSATLRKASEEVQRRTARSSPAR